MSGLYSQTSKVRKLFSNLKFKTIGDFPIRQFLGHSTIIFSMSSIPSSAISEGRLEQYKNEEVSSATTLVGPHRDDFIFKLNDRELSSFGSRGEQRMGVLWIKLAELSFVESTTEVKPTLLLDDIFSELDHAHRKLVLDTIQNHQVIMTTSDEHYVPKFKTDSIRIINL